MGLPRSDDWTQWNAGEMMAGVKYLQRERPVPGDLLEPSS